MDANNEWYSILYSFFPILRLEQKYLHCHSRPDVYQGGNGRPKGNSGFSQASLSVSPWNYAHMNFLIFLASFLSTLISLLFFLTVFPDSLELKWSWPDLRLTTLLVLVILNLLAIAFLVFCFGIGL